MENEEKLKEIAEEIQQMAQLDEVENLIKDNMIKFEHEDVRYRVRKPTAGEKELVRKKQLEKYMEYFRSSDLMLEEKLREGYEAKGISISKIEDNIIGLAKQQTELLKRLATTKNKEDIELLKKEILELKNRQFELMAKKNSYLQYSIENQVAEFVNSYYVYLLLEKEEGETWKRVYDKYEDMINTDNTTLILRGAYFLSALMYTDV